jgi:UDP-glucuronate 4-epimerase
MSVIVTGAAGFIGFHVCQRLLARGQEVVGIDNLNDYYDPALKQARLDQLIGLKGFGFVKADITDRAAMAAVAADYPEVDSYIHLAAQAGVRHSLTAPFDYSQANVVGHLTMLEMARANPRLRHFVYASSSSVYGGNTKLPFSVEDRVDQPLSLYAATKRAGELMSHSYSHLYQMPTTGLRFFTVYGPWGRPDMAAYLFCNAIVAGQPISIFNDGDMRRDFTYIDDIVSGVIGVLENPPGGESGAPPYRVYNIGNHRSEQLMDFVGQIEAAMGKKAEYRFQPMQPGDVKETYADISAIERDVGFHPTTPISVGIPKFVQWYRTYHRV